MVLPEAEEWDLLLFGRPDDKVINERHPEQLPGLKQLLGCCEIFLTRRQR